MDAHEREDFGEAEALCRRALMLEPDAHEPRQIVASSMIEQHRYREATRYLEEVLAADPDDLSALADYGLCLFELCEFDSAEVVLVRALDLEPSDPQACYWMALCIERRGDHHLADRYFLAAHEMDPEAYPSPARVSREDFTRATNEALGQIPEELRERIEQVTVVVEDLPREEDLIDYDPPIDPCVYGLYLGVPLPDRRPEGPPPELPDRICLYQRNLERFCATWESLVEEILATLLHEIGLYLGFDGEKLAKRGLA